MDFHLRGHGIVIDFAQGDAKLLIRDPTQAVRDGFVFEQMKSHGATSP
jgi:hypothetical protein